jgi:hypothetical protein
MTREAIFQAAIALPENERMELVTTLLETLGPETDGVDEEAFVAEMRRSAEIDQGKAELVPWPDLKHESF